MERRVTIAGKEYEFRYTLQDRQEIETKTKAGLWAAMLSGRLEHQAVIVWGGLRHANRKLTPNGVIELFQKHQDQGGEYDEVVRAAYWSIVDGKLLGEVNRGEMTRLIGECPGEEGKGDGAAGAA